MGSDNRSSNWSICTPKNRLHRQLFNDTHAFFFSLLFMYALFICLANNRQTLRFLRWPLSCKVFAILVYHFM